MLLAPVVAAVGQSSRRTSASVFLIPPTLAAAFYLTILIPGIPFALVMWKVRYDMDDWEDLFFECFPAWFVCVCVLVLAGPALAIGDAHLLIIAFRRCGMLLTSCLQLQWRAQQRWGCSAQVYRLCLLPCGSAAPNGRNSCGSAAGFCIIPSLESGCRPLLLC